MTILVCFGTRPEWLKVSPLLDEFEEQDVPFKSVWTGQHVDLINDGEVIADFLLYPRDSMGMINRLDEIVGGILDPKYACNPFEQEGITSVLVQGDTASTFACALAAFHRNIPVIHLEAGLRSYDLQQPYPEEGYRRMISQIASVHFCPTYLAVQNLKKEGIKLNVWCTGNTVLDNLAKLNVNVRDKSQVLITMHRRENHARIRDWFAAFDDLALSHSTHRFFFVRHPNPAVSDHCGMLKHVRVLDPLKHRQMIKMLANCTFVITDSGGIVEESSFLGKSSIVCRKETERKEAIFSGHSALCPEPEMLHELVETFMQWTGPDHLNTRPCPFGDGTASRQIVGLLRAHQWI